MKASLRIGLATAVLALAACGSSPKPTLYTLADPVRPSAPAKSAVSVAVMPASLPDLHDRPQMVVRNKDGSVQVLDQQRWAEPLRQDIPRQLAADLGRRLDSAAVVALPEDVQSLNPDFRLVLDVQRIDASLVDGVGVDVAWRLIARDGEVRQGRSVQVEPLGASGEASYAALVGAYRRAFGRVSDDIAAALANAKAAPR